MFSPEILLWGELLTSTTDDDISIKRNLKKHYTLKVNCSKKRFKKFPRKCKCNNKHIVRVNKKFKRRF